MLIVIAQLRVYNYKDNEGGKSAWNQTDFDLGHALSVENRNLLVDSLLHLQILIALRNSMSDGTKCMHLCK